MKSRVFLKKWKFYYNNSQYMLGSGLVKFFGGYKKKKVRFKNKTFKQEMNRFRGLVLTIDVYYDKIVSERKKSNPV